MVIEKRNVNCFLYGAALSANLVSFSAGSAFSWTSPVLPKLATDDLRVNPLGRPIGTMEESMLTALLSLGAALGPLLGGPVSDLLGRKSALLLCAIPMFASYLLWAFGDHIAYYCVARVLLGLGVGCSYSVLPNYIGEIAEDSNRGFLGCIMGIMIALGTLFNYVVGPYVSIMVLSIANLAPLILFFVIFGRFIPESPYYYLNFGDKEKAEDSLLKFRSNRSKGAVQKELLNIIESIEYNKNTKKETSFLDIFKVKALRNAFIVAISLMTFQQLSGICAILGYMQFIFKASGTSIPPHVAVMIIGAIQLVAVIITTILADMVGRKWLLFFSNMGCCISLAALATYFYWFQDRSANDTELDHHNMFFWVPITCLIIYIVTYNLGLGPLPWAVMGEIYPSSIKSVGSAVTTIECLVLSCLVTLFFPYTVEKIGLGNTFCFFSFFCSVGMIFTGMFQPETKGKSFPEIQKLLGRELWNKFHV